MGTNVLSVFHVECVYVNVSPTTTAYAAIVVKHGCMLHASRCLTLFYKNMQLNSTWNFTVTVTLA